MRYFLPLYPFMAMFAAVGLIALWDWARLRSGPRASIMRAGSAVVLGLVLVGTYAWAIAFTHIYTQPTTRVAASRWIYDNIPTAATLTVEQQGAPKSIQLALPSTVNYTVEQPVIASFKVDQDSLADSVVIHRLIDAAGQPDPDVLQMAIAGSPDGSGLLDQAEVTANVEVAGASGGAYTFKFRPAELKAGQTYYVITRLLSGGPLQAESSTLANEHWDDPIPLRVDGRDGFSQYHGLEMANYNEDTPDKLTQLAGWLGQADYIFLTSNRLYASIPRQPLRYPLTTEYYRLLFSGQLGFKLVASFESYPTLGPFTFPDQETTQAMGLWPDPTRCPQAGVPQCHGLINVPFPPAEEAFSVYDHPRVLIFQKTPEFSAQDVLQKLSSVSLRDALPGLSPKAETAAPNGLMLDQPVWAAQQQTGTWSDLFDRNGLLNQAPLVGAIVWYLVVALLGALAFPIVFAIAPGLRDRGYGVSRAAGLLLVSFVIWFAASYRIVPFERWSIAVTILGLAIVSGWLAWRQRAALRSFWSDSRRFILIEELVFLGAFALFLFIRLGNPDLWHPVTGGEKPMDFAYLNAVIKSQYFPPYDPWFAGGQITYYYYGFVLIAALIKLLGVMPEVAYNFAIPTLFAMTALGAYCVAFNLVSARERQPREPQPNGPRSIVGKPVVVGLIAALFVAAIGNLGEVQVISEQISQQIVGPTTFNSSLPGVKWAYDTILGLGKMIFQGAQLNFRPEWWYFTPTRLIPASPGEAGPIAEFPFFTFLYADLHAHMIDMPLTLLALALALSWVRKIPRRTWAGIGSIVLGGLVVGSLRATNTWDYPTYLAIGGAALLLGTFAAERFDQFDTWVRLAIRGIAFVGLSLIFWIPFSSHYATAYSSAEMWNGSVTPLWAYLNVHLLFLFPVVTFMVVEFIRWGWRWWRRVWKMVLGEWTIMLILAGLLAVGLAVVFYHVSPSAPLPPEHQAVPLN